MRPLGPRLGADTRSLPTPIADHDETASPAVRRPGWCLGATRVRIVRQPPDHRVARTALTTAAAAPLIGFENPARKYRTIRVESLAGHFKPELVDAAEGGQISAAETGHGSSVSHVEVFQMRRVGTFIFGRPRPLSGHRRANPSYTLNCEEPNRLFTIEGVVGV